MLFLCCFLCRVLVFTEQWGVNDTYTHAHTHTYTYTHTHTHTHTHTAFEVTNTVSPLTTRTGCKVVLTCGGFGTGIEWRKFGQTTALVINDKQNTTSEVSITLFRVTPCPLCFIHTRISYRGGPGIFPPPSKGGPGISPPPQQEFPPRI